MSEDFPVSTDELVAAVEARNGPGCSDLDRLAVAVAMADELTELADEVVGHFVEQAKESGASWSQVGTVLGVSKQAAQQRFVDYPDRRAVAAAWRWPGGAGHRRRRRQAGGGRSPFFQRFTDRARQAVTEAQREARALGHNYLGTEHLLLGILGVDDALAARALAELEVTPDAVRHRVEEVIGRGEGAGRGPVPFTPRAKKVLELALHESRELGHNYIGTEHVLLGLLREGEGVAAEILEERRVTYKATRTTLLKLLAA